MVHPRLWTKNSHFLPSNLFYSFHWYFDREPFTEHRSLNTSLLVFLSWVISYLFIFFLRLFFWVDYIDYWYFWHFWLRYAPFCCTAHSQKGLCWLTSGPQVCCLRSDYFLNWFYTLVIPWFLSHFAFTRKLLVKFLELVFTLLRFYPIKHL